MASFLAAEGREACRTMRRKCFPLRNSPQLVMCMEARSRSRWGKIRDAIGKTLFPLNSKNLMAAAAWDAKTLATKF